MNKVVGIYRGKEGLNEINQEWEQLGKRCGHSFLHYPYWYRAELEANDKKHQKVFFITVHLNGELQAVLPFELVERKYFKFSLCSLELFYANEMSACDITSCISLDEISGKILSEIKKEFPRVHMVRIHGAPGDSCYVLSKLNFGFSYSKLSHNSKFLDISSGEEEFWKKYSNKYKRNIRRKVNKISKDGEVALICKNVVNVNDLTYLQFLEVESAGWKGRNKTSIKFQADKRAYYDSLIEGFGRIGMCQINLLKLGDKCIAAQFSVRVDKTLFLLKIGYDEDYANASPGDLLLYKLISYGCTTKKISSISFITDFTWMDKWIPKSNPVAVSYYSAYTLIGTVVITMLRLKNFFIK